MRKLAYKYCFFVNCHPSRVVRTADGVAWQCERCDELIPIAKSREHLFWLGQYVETPARLPITGSERMQRVMRWYCFIVGLHPCLVERTEGKIALRCQRCGRFIPIKENQQDLFESGEYIITGSRVTRRQRME